MALAHAIAGAGAGFLVGGPLGAAVGAVAGALLGKDPIGEGSVIHYAPGAAVTTSRAATAADVQTVVVQNAARGVSTLLTPDNALGRLRGAADALAASVGPSADAWLDAVYKAISQMTYSLMMTPGAFAPPPAFTVAVASAPGSSAGFKAAAADAVAALAAMDQAKARGLAEYLWRGT